MISFPVILLRLAVALLLGAVIGFEREQKEHAAGMRTLALVSLGCALLPSFPHMVFYFSLPSLILRSTPLVLPLIS